MGRSTARAVRIGLGVSILVVGMVVVWAAPVSAQDGNGQPRFTICHHTGSETNPIVEITVANPAILAAHLAHGDTFAGPNGCDTDPGPGPGPDPGRVTICHATGSATNPYVRITVADDATFEGHAGHAGDIIPAPANGCPGPQVVHPPVVVPPPVVVSNPPVARPVPLAPPAPTVVASSGAVATPVKELPRTGSNAIAIQLAIALALLGAGWLSLKASAWATPTDVATATPSGSAPTAPRSAPTSPVAHRSAPPWSVPNRASLFREHVPDPTVRAGPFRRRRSRAP